MPKGKIKTYSELYALVADAPFAKYLSASNEGITLIPVTPPTDLTSSDPKKQAKAMTQFMAEMANFAKAQSKLEVWKLQDSDGKGTYRRVHAGGGGKVALTPQELKERFIQDIANLNELSKVPGFENLLLVKGKTLSSLAGAIRTVKESNLPVTVANVNKSFKTRNTKKETQTV